MSIVNFPRLGVKKESGDWRLLEEKTINDRSIVVWYDCADKISSLMIFHVSDQPNKISKQSPHTTWGFLTHYMTKMHTLKEAAEVVSLYLQDMEKENFWWEKIN